MTVETEGGFRVTGNGCERGVQYARDEITNPTRIITSTVRVSDARLRRCPVKLSAPIPKGKIFEAMGTLDEVVLNLPIRAGQVAVSNVCGTGVDFITTAEMHISG
jgi:CxxC motif-containing protein